ncbi:ABC transporter ATP-binding protein [Luteitalea sp. TBR-22]|uniref:ABC transporter ATP-binding protein n=1 Tax=Luteitalea sp. TBR-22 TaxID=2802971 RepID=UPI001AF806A0|nr:ABC transporter ATP-binding protein [Luteitalea sp. TBR-22]BCS33767.1 ABC transporter ATP-binding protein [Luteitalea sp. TBR-22]
MATLPASGASSRVAARELADELVALRCRGLVKRYGAVVAVDGLDLEVRTGECFGLLGPNGAGKTTTIEILEGLTTPDAGDVEVLGMRWASDGDRLRQRLGIQLQETQLNEKLTATELLRLFRSFYAQGPTVDALLASVGLESKRDAWYGKLSGGQKQRLALACALAGDPDLLFLDEPTTGLDPQSRRQLWDLLAAYKQRGRTVLITTHYMDEAQVLCDRVAIVDQGKVIALGTPLELIASLGAEHVVEFALAEDAAMPTLEALGGLPGVRRASLADGRGTLIVARLHEALPALLALVADPEAFTLLTTHSATLEDVFVSLTGRHLRDV